MNPLVLFEFQVGDLTVDPSFVSGSPQSYVFRGGRYVASSTERLDGRGIGEGAYTTIHRIPKAIWLTPKQRQVIAAIQIARKELADHR
jgi:hypothetical protein